MVRQDGDVGLIATTESGIASCQSDFIYLYCPCAAVVEGLKRGGKYVAGFANENTKC